MTKPPSKKAPIPPKVAAPLPSQSDFFADSPTGSSVPVGATATRGPYTSASSIAAASKAPALSLAPLSATSGSTVEHVDNDFNRVRRSLTHINDLANWTITQTCTVALSTANLVCKNLITLVYTMTDLSFFQ